MFLRCAPGTHKSSSIASACALQAHGALWLTAKS